MKPIDGQTIVALFVRRPVPGRVKTRLARDLGDEAACDLYRAMVTDVIAAVRESRLPLVLFHDGDHDTLLPPEWCAAATYVFRQEGDGLGDRMTRAFERSFTAGAGSVILIGSDIPGIDAPLLTAAGAAVRDHDAVFAPAFDGGYCLVASRRERFNGGMFSGIPWSTPGVLAATVAACAACGMSHRLLEPRLDIDTLADLEAYRRTPSGSARMTNAWLASHEIRGSE